MNTDRNGVVCAVEPLFHTVMKKVIYFSLISLALAVVSFIQPPGTLVGQWQQKFAGNITVRSVYRTNGTFDIFINGKTFVTGTYKVNQDTLSISDPICGGGYYGTYRLTFISPDSVRQTLIQDTCRVRRTSISQSPASSRIQTVKP